MAFKRKNIFESTMTIHEFPIMMDKLEYVGCTSKRKKKEKIKLKKERMKEKKSKKNSSFLSFKYVLEHTQIVNKHITQIFPLTKLLLKMPALYINTNI